MAWIETVLKTYPPIAVFIALAFGYWFGKFNYRGLGLGAVTSTLIAAVAIGQFNIPISPMVGSFFFLLFLFAVGYGVGPQFVRGLAKDGLKQALFAVVVCLLCLGSVWLAARLAGYNAGTAAGLFAGSQTLSASMGLATDSINQLAITVEEKHRLLNEMPVAYAVTYLFGTVGSAIILALLGPKLLRVDLAKECAQYEASMGGMDHNGSGNLAWHPYEIRAFQVGESTAVSGQTVSEIEHLFPHGGVFIERLRRGSQVMAAKGDMVVNTGDVLAITGSRHILIDIIGAHAKEVDDRELLSIPMEGIDIFITSRTVSGKTIAEISKMPEAHGVFLCRITRGLTGEEIPLLPKTVIQRGDVLSVSGRTADTTIAASAWGRVDRPGSVTDVMTLALAITIGCLVGAVTIHIGSIPLTLSTAGGALIAGLITGWLRSIHPTFGYIPTSTVWFMNSVGLNVFIAGVGIASGPTFVAGLENLGAGIFLWGMFATTLPLVLAIFIGKYLFRFHPAILLGACAGARTTTAALGMINEIAHSQVPTLGYTVTYAVGNTLLTIWGMVIILLMT